MIEFIEADIEFDKLFGFAVVCRMNDVTVGTCRLIDWREVCPMIAYVAVPEIHRRKGVATAMINACIEKARDAGKESIALSVKRTNITAITLYRKLGFHVTMTGPDDYWMAVVLQEGVK